MATTKEDRAAKAAADKALASRVWPDGVHVGMGQMPGDPLINDLLLQGIKLRADAQLKQLTRVAPTQPTKPKEIK